MQEELGGWEAFWGVEESEENYGIYVFMEFFDDNEPEERLKMLAPALSLKEELGHPVNVVLAGKVSDEIVEMARQFPVSKIHVKKMDSAQGLLEFLREFISETKPFVIIGDLQGKARELFPYLAQEMDAGYLGGGLYVSLSPEDNKVTVKRKIYGGLLIETVKNLKDGVQFITVDTSSFELPEKGESQDVEVKEW